MEQEEESVFVSINLGKNAALSKKITESPLKNYIEIKPKYLKFFYGNWVKYISKKTKEYNSGGFLTEINYLYKTIYLRNNVNSEKGNNTNRIYPLEDYIYFVKNDTEHYRAYLNIKQEYDKIKLKTLNANKMT